MHAAGLIILLGGCYLAAQLQAVQLGAVWGLKSIDWYWIAIFTAVLHQVYVWICWRIELHNKGLTTLLGPGAFPAFAFGFAVIGISQQLSALFRGNAGNTLGAEIARRAALPPPKPH
jgi:hypothetical protein